jgi:hypothetical protein
MTPRLREARTHRDPPGLEDKDTISQISSIHAYRAAVWGSRNDERRGTDRNHTPLRRTYPRKFLPLPE